MAYTIYMITCEISGKSYIGLTKFGIQKRWKEHRWQANKARKRWVSVLHRAIRVYGEDAFQIAEICRAHSDAEANELEIKMIEHFKTLVPNGYNVTTGGQGCPGVRKKMPPAFGQQISERQRGRPNSEIAKARMSAAHKGKILSESHKANIGAAFAGKKRPEISLAMLSKGAGSRRNPSSGFTGVTKCANGWMARIKIDGKTKYLGKDKTPEGASRLYQEALAKRLAELRVHQS